LIPLKTKLSLFLILFLVVNSFAQENVGLELDTVKAASALRGPEHVRFYLENDLLRRNAVAHSLDTTPHNMNDEVIFKGEEDPN